MSEEEKKVVEGEANEANTTEAAPETEPAIEAETEAEAVA